MKNETKDRELGTIDRYALAACRRPTAVRLTMRAAIGHNTQAAPIV